MKKLMNVLAAAVLISGLAGCAEGGGLLGSAGGEVEVRVAAALDGGASVTKAYGEEGTPSTANRVILEVYMNDAGTPALYGERLYAKAEETLRFSPACVSLPDMSTSSSCGLTGWRTRIPKPA